MDYESFIGAFGDVPTNLAGEYGQLFIFHAEDFGAWYRRVRDAHQREVDGGVAGMTDADLAEHGMVRLPKDADGEYIRIGDVMDGYGKTIEVVELRYERSGWVLISRDGSGWVCTIAFEHHHAPTVEDVLRALTDEVWNRCCEGATASDSGIDELVAECAAKLRLAGEDE